jgi:hypothetical protein
MYKVEEYTPEEKAKLATEMKFQATMDAGCKKRADDAAKRWSGASAASRGAGETEWPPMWVQDENELKGDSRAVFAKKE